MNEEKDIERQLSTDDNPQQEQQLNQPSIDETSNEAEQPQTINNKPETEDMEVHHHTHAAHGKKNWKQYFWEFLMLFLAVFCGFLAEYQLEHKIEKNREKQFIESYIEDLETDTAAIRRTVANLERKQAVLDSFMLLLKTGQIRGHENDLYFFGRTLIRSTQFQRNDRTISQLINSGSWRLIRNKQAVDSMQAYNKEVENNDINQESEGLERRSCIPILEKMFDPFVFDTMVDGTIIRRHLVTGNPPLRSYERELQKDLSHKIHQIKSSCFLIINRLKKLERKATNMIALLKNEYHLE